MSGDQFVSANAKDPIDVSFVMACYNAAEFLEDAIQSALAQRDVGVEVIVVDDGSTDGSQEIARRCASMDARVRLLQTQKNLGPAGARNLGLANMRGNWYAVLDADDLIEPQRSRTLIGVAGLHGADMVADNLIQFGKGITERPMCSIAPRGGTYEMTLSDYLERSCLFVKEAGPGYLKPMIRAQAIDRAKLSYDESLWIAEDDEFVIKALLAELRYVLTDYAGYRYRRHDASISHRLSLSNLERMIAAEEKVALRLPEHVRKSSPYLKRKSALHRAHAFTRSIEAMKSRDFLSAIMAIVRRPSALMLYSMPLRSKFGRLRARAK